MEIKERMKELGRKRLYRQSVVVPVATFIYAVGVALFLDPNEIAPGGVTGVAIVLNRLCGIDTGTLILLINIPLLIIAWRRYGLRMVVSSLYSLFFISLFTNILKNFPPLTDDLILAAVGGGVMMALGLGTILRTGATTGGTDIVVKLIRESRKHLKVNVLFLLVDLCVLAFSFVVLRDVEQVMYSAITLGVISIVMEPVLYGRDEGKQFIIISEHAQELSVYFMKELGIGVTFLEGMGGYTNQRKLIIMCVVKKRIAPFLQEAVKELDQQAFMIVSDAGEVYGKGYKKY